MAGTEKAYYFYQARSSPKGKDTDTASGWSLNYQSQDSPAKSGSIPTPSFSIACSKRRRIDDGEKEHEEEGSFGELAEDFFNLPATNMREADMELDRLVDKYPELLDIAPMDHVEDDGIDNMLGEISYTFRDIKEMLRLSQRREASLAAELNALKKSKEWDELYNNSTNGNT